MILWVFLLKCGIVALVMASSSSSYNLEGEISSIPTSEVENTTTEDNFQQTIELLQVDAEELTEEVSRSAEEVSFIARSVTKYVVRYPKHHLCFLFVF
jgi:hypothetical protein